jgi:hypothetical protein
MMIHDFQKEVALGIPWLVLVATGVGFQAGRQKTGGKMERFRRIVQDIANAFRVCCNHSVIAVEWMIGVILLVANVVGSACRKHTSCPG